jgi:hypothetical protein
VSWSVTDSPDLKKLIISVEYQDLPKISGNQEPDRIFIKILNSKLFVSAGTAEPFDIELASSEEDIPVQFRSLGKSCLPL